MHYKSFDFVHDFYVDAREGTDYPIIEVRLLTYDGLWLRFPMLFDTGATDIVLRPRYARAFPIANKWVKVEAAGQSTPREDIPVTTSRIDVFGQITECEILLMEIPPNPLYAGLLGRKAFKAFGFGFWEFAKELHVSFQP
jgi:hypothetical protein